MLALMGSRKLHHGEWEIVCFVFPFYVLCLAVCRMCISQYEFISKLVLYHCTTGI